MELINIYNNERKIIKQNIDRYTYKCNENEYTLSVQMWIIINDDEEIILTKRAKNKTYPGLWECTEGVVQANETSLEGAIREVKEELGLEIYPSEIIKLDIPNEIEYPKFTDVYLCKKIFL